MAWIRKLGEISLRAKVILLVGAGALVAAVIALSHGASVLSIVMFLFAGLSAVQGVPIIMKIIKPPLATVTLDEYLKQAMQAAIRLPIDDIFDRRKRPKGGSSVSLPDVYVPLDIEPIDEDEVLAGKFRHLSWERAEGIPLLEEVDRTIDPSATNANANGMRAVVVGEAGCGKSSLSSCLLWGAQKAAVGEAPAGWPRSLMSRTVARLNLSMMRRLIRPDPMRRPNDRLTPSQLLQAAFCYEMNRTMGWDETQFQLVHSELTERLRNSGLLIFDGLDEVLDETDRAYVCTTILQAAKELGPNCGILVTARPYAYSPAELGSFAIWRLLPLTLPRDHGSDGQVGLLVRNWHKALRIPDAQSDALIAALREDPDRIDMAKRPLLLTLLIGVHARRRHQKEITALPRIRVDLLDEATQLMMERWFQRIDRDSDKGYEQIPPHIVEWLKKRGNNDKSELRRLAEQVSFDVQNHRKGGAETDIELSRQDFTVAVGKLIPTMTFEMIERTVHLILDRTALWFSRGDHENPTKARYAYIHRQFQEFLAACHIVESPDERKQLPRKLGENPAAWREVARLAVVWTARSQAESAASSLLRELMPDCTAGFEGTGTGSAGPNATIGDSRAGVYQHIIATGWALLELHAALDQDALRNLVIEEDLTRVATDFQSCYQRLISDSEVPGHLRLEAGEIAGRLGLVLGASFADARPGIVPVAWNSDVDEQFALTVHDFRWVPIPSGPHLWMTRYPITQSQYAAFVRTEGLSRHFEDCPSYWKFSTEAVEWWMKNHRAPDVSTANTGGNWSLLKDALPNFPVVGVSWFDVVAFCQWLETQLSLETGNWIRPPTCNQWQQAAVRWRGALPQRIQGARTDRDCDAAMGAVGLYDPEPGSTEPQIPVDLAGSIFEWVLTKWDAKAVGPRAGGYQLDTNADDLVGAEDRLILGGPFRHDADARRQQSSRAHLAPDTEDIRVGFRICLHGDLEYLTRIS